MGCGDVGVGGWRVGTALIRHVAWVRGVRKLSVWVDGVWVQP